MIEKELTIVDHENEVLELYTVNTPHGLVITINERDVCLSVIDAIKVRNFINEYLDFQLQTIYPAII